MSNTLVRTAVAPVAEYALDDSIRLGGILAQSGFFSDAREAAQAVVKILAGRELGFGPIASMTGIYIVKGRVTMSANLMAAAVQRSGRFDYSISELDDQHATLTFYDDAEPVGDVTFTMDDAKRAGLAGGDNWRKYPSDMLFARAMSRGTRRYCPAVFGGPVYTPEELGADADPEGQINGASRARLHDHDRDDDASSPSATSLLDAPAGGAAAQNPTPPPPAALEPTIEPVERAEPVEQHNHVSPAPASASPPASSLKIGADGNTDRLITPKEALMLLELMHVAAVAPNRQRMLLVEYVDEVSNVDDAVQLLTVAQARHLAKRIEDGRS